MLYSLTQGVFNDGLQNGFKRLSRIGYDYIEIPGPCDAWTANDVIRFSKEYNLPVFSVSGAHSTPENDFSNVDDAARKNAIRLYKQTIELAAEVGAKRIVCLPTGGGKPAPVGPVQQEWDNCVNSIREFAEYALSLNPEMMIAIEPVNFYETYLINRLSTGLKMIKEIDMPNVGLTVDTFHVMVGERNVADELKKVMPYVCHFHVSDSNREAPGFAQQNLKEIFNVAIESGYDDVMTAEFIPLEYVEPGIYVHAFSPEVYDETAERALKEMKRLEVECKASM